MNLKMKREPAIGQGSKVDGRTSISALKGSAIASEALSALLVLGSVEVGDSLKRTGDGSGGREAGSEKGDEESLAGEHGRARRLRDWLEGESSSDPAGGSKASKRV